MYFILTNINTLEQTDVGEKYTWWYCIERSNSLLIYNKTTRMLMLHNFYVIGNKQKSLVSTYETFLLHATVIRH